MFLKPCKTDIVILTLLLQPSFSQKDESKRQVKTNPRKALAPETEPTNRPRTRSVVQAGQPTTVGSSITSKSQPSETTVVDVFRSTAACTFNLPEDLRPIVRPTVHSTFTIAPNGTSARQGPITRDSQKASKNEGTNVRERTIPFKLIKKF